MHLGLVRPASGSRRGRCVATAAAAARCGGTPGDRRSRGRLLVPQGKWTARAAHCRHRDERKRCRAGRGYVCL